MGDETALLRVLAVDRRVRSPAGPALLASLAGLRVAIVDGQADAGLRASREALEAPARGGELELVVGGATATQLVVASDSRLSAGRAVLVVGDNVCR